MNRKVIFGLLTLSLIFFVAVAESATFKHKYIMRGQILEVSGDTAYLCIGSEDGAKVGQKLTVYRFVKTGSPPHSPVSYTREETGKVKITEIVDEHMANAKIISGEAKENYIVELK